MSSSVTVVGGVNNGALNGLVAVPLAGVSATAQSALQSALTAISNEIVAGTVSFTNVDQVTGTTALTTGTSATGGLFVVSDQQFSSSAPAIGAALTGSYTVGTAFSTIIVEAPGTETVSASNNNGQSFVLGANSNVDLFTGMGTGSVIAAGGNDTLNLQGTQSAVISAGNDRVKTYSGSTTVVATGSASVFASVVKGYAGSMNFVNNSSSAALVAGGSGSLTVFGGAGGGQFSGGTAGNNLLIAGSGAAVLVGAGNNDVLDAGFNADGVTPSATVTGNDYLFAGSGNETLQASSATGTNLFQAGVGSDVISSAGSGNQFFFGNSGTATMTGSTASGAVNVYFFGTPTATGGNDVITNFNLATDKLFAIDGTNITSVTGSTVNGTPGVLVSLSDGTQITMQGITVAQASVYAGGSFI
jgi:Ca2+-binding RTX toxin-like protein